MGLFSSFLLRKVPRSCSLYLCELMQHSCRTIINHVICSGRHRSNRHKMIILHLVRIHPSSISTQRWYLLTLTKVLVVVPVFSPLLPTLRQLARNPPSSTSCSYFFPPKSPAGFPVTLVYHFTSLTPLVISSRAQVSQFLRVLAPACQVTTLWNIRASTPSLMLQVESP